MAHDVFKQSYDFELEQRNHLIDAVNVPILALTVLGGALVTMVMNFPYSEHQPVGRTAFLVVAVLASTALLIAVFAVFRALVGYWYEKIPSATKWNHHYEKLVSLYGGRSDGQELIAREFDNAVTVVYGKAADANAKINRKRGRWFFVANISVAIAATLLAVAGGLFTFASITEKVHIQEIRIVP